VGLGRAAGSDDKDKDKGKNKPPAVQDAVVQFGTLATGAAGHILDPDEVTIVKGGTVTWMVNGGGHGIGIYRVDRHTTRADISDDLCQPGSTCTANDERIITDHKGDIVADPGTNPPNTRLNDQNHILLGRWGGIPRGGDGDDAWQLGAVPLREVRALSDHLHEPVARAHRLDVRLRERRRRRRQLRGTANSKTRKHETRKHENTKKMCSFFFVLSCFRALASLSGKFSC
jgi:hypothetical protein